MPEARTLHRKAEALWREAEAGNDPVLAFVSLAQLYDLTTDMPGEDQRAWRNRIAAFDLDDATAAALQARNDAKVDRLNHLCSSGRLIGEEVALVYTLYQELEQVKALLDSRGCGHLIDLSRLEPEALHWIGRRRSTKW